jgi:hypothetical protein
MQPRDAFEASFRGLPLFPSVPPLPAITADQAAEEARAIIAKFLDQKERREIREWLDRQLAGADAHARKIWDTLRRIDQRAAAKRKAAQQGAHKACSCGGSSDCYCDDVATAKWLLGPRACQGMTPAQCRRHVNQVLQRVTEGRRK